MDEILVLAEHRKEELREITFEMLSLADKLAQENQLRITSLVLGHQTSDLADRLKRTSDTVLLMDAPELKNYNADFYLEGLGAVIRRRQPILVIIGHTSQGMDLAPGAATRFSLPMVSDCVDVFIKDRALEVRRQIYGGKINEQLTMKPSKQYLITLRAGSFPHRPDLGKRAVIEDMPPPPWSESRGRRFIDTLESAFDDVDISGADILVSVGRGIGNPENIPKAQALADAVGATLSCSRPVADKGWLPKGCQVGTSGKTVRPKVYIALGISGAFQHQVGMKNAGTIIAVNKDPKAPIFNVAHYGIVGDVFQVLPLLTEKLTQR
jgi:electron transfer flavoprotein alpha subunit